MFVFTDLLKPVDPFENDKKTAVFQHFHSNRLIADSDILHMYYVIAYIQLVGRISPKIHY